MNIKNLLLPLLLALPLSSWAATQAGTVVLLTGQATALSTDGTVRKLAKNAPVFPGDLVSSGIGSYVNLKFADGAFFLLRPETRFQIEQFEFVAAPTPTPVPAAPVAAAPAAPKPVTPAAPLVTAGAQAAPTSRAFFRLVKGGFRSVSGLIGKLNREDYRVSTPVATIGIRGTSYSARICEGRCEDREQIVTDLAAAGKAITADDVVLITTVDDGSISVLSPTGEALQNACKPATGENAAGAESTCGALVTSSDGSSTVIPRRPDTENSERNLDPALCL